MDDCTNGRVSFSLRCATGCYAMLAGRTAVFKSGPGIQSSPVKLDERCGAIYFNTNDGGERKV
jgi:hypothetical protein